MSDSDSPDLRIGDREREEAMAALGQHFREGRLNVDEYGERVGKVTESRTRADLAALFTDLPEPRPTLVAPESKPARTAESASRPAPQPPHPYRLAGVFMGLAWISGIALASTTHVWIFIFLPIVLSTVFGSFWGRDRRHRHDRAQR